MVPHACGGNLTEGGLTPTRTPAKGTGVGYEIVPNPPYFNAPLYYSSRPLLVIPSRRRGIPPPPLSTAPSLSRRLLRCHFERSEESHSSHCV